MRALKNEEDSDSKKRFSQIQKELQSLKTKVSGLEKLWKKEKEKLKQIRELRKQIESAKQEISRYEREYNLAKVAELKFGLLPDLLNKLKNAEESTTSSKLICESVTQDQITSVVSRWTGIPITSLLKREKERLLNLESALHKRVVGQDLPVEIVSDCIIRSNQELKIRQDRLVHLFF